MTAVHAAPSLPEVLDRLDRLTDWEKRPRGGMRVGLAPMRDLLHRLGEPQASLRVIHVAGTKGKGSVCALIEAGLMRAGLRVGCYASPHVESVVERVCLQGRPVGEAVLARALARALDAHEAARRDDTAGADATWFDVLTAAALAVFGEAGLDWAVIEVGLGGRLDSTNAVDGAVAVVTNIGLEHTEILGDTRAAIAAEKVGILKPGAGLVTTLPPDDEAGAVLAARAAALGCPVLRPPAPGGSIAQENAGLAGLVLGYLGAGGARGRDGSPLGAGLLDAAARAGAVLPGRLERRALRTAHGPVPVVLDGAHVPFNLAAVMRDLGRDPDLAGPCTALVALAGDKDAAGFLAVLARHAGYVVATEMPERRGHAAAALRALAAAEGVEAEAVAMPDAALARAADLAARRGGWLLVTGSLHLVGALRGATDPS
ncbi:bifunctional folylpolyglutamate synthase/dihydrofolate synthase [Methylobacterium platani]|uniref:Dihydrofolate synthase/folylpolyglutamate synthase n=2 Tax=Methylobacterium platani TaxID=427683 RepID=A0A179S4A3_9HYPH|nr:Mur ligase family protein [Methylobacterium platani]KMO21017.1 folylpolyglutamate synthase [Methylobacterium platani JCM 14648]OAS19750.1 bifunctional folylpolyglutamate synthase/dihydrofolate synthase [Methylobacterium platani]